MAELAGAVSCRMSCCAFSRQNQVVLDGSRLTVPTEGSLFLYLAWEPLPHQALLEALTIAHKARLWRAFLENGLHPLEFD
ncbi:hypothetical protein [Yanshouia hominis]|uniref:Uncharacterized protein n=1 Tax=Yanshouia hominis TaxID=2763673 RepID=A0ABR7NGG6_9FIRM|nr:hypothetical protein [Yanshouia hominis]MBC8575495.1 hypothetical protein [Yanshouia hominis]